MNAGKSFEQDFKNSVPETTLFLRLPDGGGWSNAENTRFTPSNLCDCILFTHGILYLLELKSHLGKSIPMSAMKQLPKLAEIQKQAVRPCLVLNYRDYHITYLISAQRAIECLQTRKSIPISWCEEYGKVIPQTLKRTHYKYNLNIL